MLNRSSAGLSFALLAACSASSGEDSAASHAAVTSSSLSNLVVVATDATLSFAFTAPTLAAAYTVSISGPTSATQTATLLSTSAAQNQSATFSGLTTCASYAWSIAAAGSVVLSGQTNTRESGTSACATAEAIALTELDIFHGLEHQESTAIYCDSSDWSPALTSWPVNSEGWNARTFTGSHIPRNPEIQFGYSNWSNGASGPLPCSESTVDAYRAQLKYAMAPWQEARVTDATFSASYFGGQCVSALTALQSGQGVDWPQEASGGEWAPILGIAESSDTIIPVVSHAPAWPVTWGTSTFSADLGKPIGTTVLVGFEANDGFSTTVDPVNFNYAVENATCTTTFSAPVLTLSYAPMPPETPIGCTGTITCGNATVTCLGSPDVFELERIYSTGQEEVVATLDDTSGGADVVLVDPQGSTDVTYDVCTVNSSGATACGPVEWTELVACTTPTPTGGGGSSGAPYGPGCKMCPKPQ